jgi:hypothetical protein
MLHKAVMTDIYHLLVMPNGHGLHVSISSHQKVQSDQYLLHDDAHDPELWVSSRFRAMVEVDNCPAQEVLKID